MGKNTVLENFEGSIVTFKSSGALYPIQVNLLCEILHKLLYDDLWAKALNLCRRMQVHKIGIFTCLEYVVFLCYNNDYNLIIKDPILWATLAAISSKKNQLEIAEEAYSSSLQIDKVKYLQHIKVKMMVKYIISTNANKILCRYRICLQVAMSKWQRFQ